MNAIRRFLMSHGRALFTAAIFAVAVIAAAHAVAPLAAQSKANSAGAAEPAGREYSGMYSFLKDGEFVQVTVEDEGRVTGFVSRYGEGESDKGAFLDQFFRSGKLDGRQLSFATETVHAVWYQFKGTVERGDGKNPGDEAYYELKGTLTENTVDAQKKDKAHAREVVFKMFPRESSPPPSARN
jgi:hypothetical protein